MCTLSCPPGRKKKSRVNGNHYTRHNQIAGANFLFLILLVDIGTHTSGATGILLYTPPGTSIYRPSAAVYSKLR